MKIYISGQITGLPEEESRANFKRAQEYLESAGHTVINPFDLPHNHKKTWDDYMREDLQALLTCDTIFMLDNWTKSKGAQIEFNLALDLDMGIILE